MIRLGRPKLFCASACGAGIAALCCFTPVLALVLGVVGLSAWLGWADWVLLPALVVFVALAIHALRPAPSQSRADKP